MNFDFELPEELDPVDKARLDEQYQAELQASMDYAFDIISKAGPEVWVEEVPFSQEKTRRILKNMINWFCLPEREEYEKAALIQRGISRLEKL